MRVPTRVTSLREVNWARFEPNFFVVFERRALEDAPKQFVLLADVRGADAVARLQRDVVARFPNVSSLDLSLIQQTVSRVLDRVTAAIRFLAVLSLALGVPVLFSAVSATRRERLREGVLLKTLGATRRQVGRIMLSEYLLLGALGSIAGIVLTLGGAWGLMHFVFRQPFVPAVLPRARRRARDDRRVRLDRIAHGPRRVPGNADGGVTGSVAPPSSVPTNDVPYCWNALSGIVSPCALT